MTLLSRPWSLDDAAKRSLGPNDCFLAELSSGTATGISQASHVRLLAHDGSELRLFPYPISGSSPGPPEVSGIPARPNTGREPQNPKEKVAAGALARMHEILARVGDLKSALDDPEYIWVWLEDAWLEKNFKIRPSMAEIVRQAHEMPLQLGLLRDRIRRVLRRSRERVPVDRAQELDRSSMIWFARQPGRTIAERAGPSQRVLAIARHENFDTLENQVVHAYVRIAHLVCRQWMLEHARSEKSDRYRTVETFAQTCQRFDRELEELSVGLAESGTIPNYILVEDRNYRIVREAWLRLLRQESLEDDLWAWQAQSWIDFCVLALVLSLNQLQNSELVVQSPIVWLDEAETGQQYLCDNPLAVFWLRCKNLVVEVLTRPEDISRTQANCRAWVWLRISNASRNTFRFVPVWTPHTFERMDTREAAREAARFLSQTLQSTNSELIRDGLIILPANGSGDFATEKYGRTDVAAVALGASGPTLKDGLNALSSYVSDRFGRTS